MDSNLTDNEERAYDTIYFQKRSGDYYAWSRDGDGREAIDDQRQAASLSEAARSNLLELIDNKAHELGWCDEDRYFLWGE